MELYKNKDVLENGGYGATQLACYIIEKNNNITTETKDEINYVKLLKLMYLVERELIVNLLPPITSDDYVAMDYGPVLSKTYDCIKYKGNNNIFWSEYLKTEFPKPLIPLKGKVKLIKKMTDDDYIFSHNTKKIIDSVLNRFIKLTDEELSKLSHIICPEWEETFNGAERKNNSPPIVIETILDFSDKNETEKVNYMNTLIGLRNENLQYNAYRQG